MGRHDNAMAEALLRYFRAMDHAHRQALIALARRMAHGEHHAPPEHVSVQSALTNH